LVAGSETVTCVACRIPCLDPAGDVLPSIDALRTYLAVRAIIRRGSGDGCHGRITRTRLRAGSDEELDTIAQPDSPNDRADSR